MDGIGGWLIAGAVLVLLIVLRVKGGG